MAEQLLAVALLLAGSVVLGAAAIRVGILLGGILARSVDRDEEDPGGPAV